MASWIRYFNELVTADEWHLSYSIFLSVLLDAPHELSQLRDLRELKGIF